MLYEWAKNKKDELKAKKLLQNFPKTGNKGINVNNFLELNQDYITYKLLGKKYRGYFTKKQQDDLFLILDYFESKIITIN